jgi:hypothetical protein
MTAFASLEPAFGDTGYPSKWNQVLEELDARFPPSTPSWAVPGFIGQTTPNQAKFTTIDVATSITGIGTLDGNNFKVLPKRDMTTGGAPSAGALAIGQTYFDFVQGKIYGKDAGGAVIQFAVSAAGFTNEDAQDAVGNIMTDSTTIDFTYDDVGNSISAAIKSKSISFSLIQDINTARLLGRSTALSGDIEQIAIGTGLSLSGGVLSATGGGGSSYTDEQAQDAVGGILIDTTTIDFTYNDAANQITADLKTGSVQYSHIQNVTTQRVLGRSTAGAGLIEEIQIGSGLSLSGGILSTTGGGPGSYTDENAQDAVGGILVDSSTIDFTYDDAGNSITAIVKDSSITLAKLQQLSPGFVLGRATAGTGNVEQLTATVAGLTLLAGADAGAQRTSLGLGSAATKAEGSGSGLNADMTDGYHANEAANGSTLAARNSFGHVFATAFNSTNGVTNPSVTEVFCGNGDGYIYKATNSHFMSQLGLINTGVSKGTTGVGTRVYDGASGTALLFRRIRSGSNDILVNASVDGNYIDISYSPGSPQGSNDSLHPHSLIEMADGSQKWLQDLRPGDMVRGSKGPARVLGMRIGILGDKKYAQINGRFVCTPGHLIPQPRGRWAAVDPKCYAECSYGKRKTVKGPRGLITVLSKICDPQKVKKLERGMKILTAKGWETVRSIRLFDHVPNQSHTIAVLLEGSKVLFCDGYAVGTLA